MTVKPLPILYCHCAYANAVSPEVKQEVLRKLVESGVPFEAVADLCQLSAAKDPALAELAADPALRIVACYPRAVGGLFAAAGAPLRNATAAVLNMREQTAEAIVERLLTPTAAVEEPAR